MDAEVVLRMVLKVLLVVMLALPAYALPAPEWRFPAFPLRTVFHVPAEARASLMLKVARTEKMPATPDGFLACDPDGVPMPLRVAYAGSDEVALTLAAPPMGERPCTIYYGGLRGGGALRSPEAAPDPAPLAVGFMPMRGRAIPTSWGRLRHMLKTSGTQLETPYRVAGFDELDKAMEEADSAKTGRQRGSRHRHGGGMRAAVTRSFLLSPKDGAYRFALDCTDAGFVVLDGELVVAWPGEHDSKEWQLGAPLTLKAGVHRLDVYNVFDGSGMRLRVGWTLPGRKDIMPISTSDLIASCEAMETRAERLNRTLQPGFVATPLKAYSFRGDPNVFVAVRYQNITENWIASELESRWKFGDGAQSSESSPVHVYASADTFKASLEVRDKLGFVAACSESVDCRQIQPEEYAVSFDLTGVPAVCFGGERMAPYIRIQGAGPADLAMEASWEITRHSGGVERGHQDISPKGTQELLALPPVTGADTDSIHWRISHRQVTLTEESIAFLHAPCAVRPVRIEGDRLYDAQGRRLVLVPAEGSGSFRQPSLTQTHRLGRLVCVDDTLAVPGLLATGGQEPFDRILARLLTGRINDVRYAALPEWERFQDSYGPLRKFVDVPAALSRERADVAILSIGLRDILETRDVGVFEREAAALSDLVAVGMGIPVIWVTPPPYPVAPERSRVFAAAIRRVADARGMPVADLFTAFRCAADNRHTFFQDNPLALTDEGHRLAGQQIARALVGE